MISTVTDAEAMVPSKAATSRVLVMPPLSASGMLSAAVLWHGLSSQLPALVVDCGPSCSDQPSRVPVS